MNFFAFFKNGRENNQKKQNDPKGKLGMKARGEVFQNEKFGKDKKRVNQLLLLLLLFKRQMNRRLADVVSFVFPSKHPSLLIEFLSIFKRLGLQSFPSSDLLELRLLGGKQDIEKSDTF